MTPAYLALGSNLGDRKTILDAAVAALAETPGVLVQAVSSYHETAPVGGPTGQGAFLNAAAAIETSLDPFSLLDVLLAIEAEAGRVRTVHWGERSLDLDLLLYGDRLIESPTLIVPHPRMGVRRFVMAPLAEIASDAMNPISHLTASQSLALLDRRPSYVAILAPPDPIRDQVFRLVRESLDAEAVAPWGPPPEITPELRRWRAYPWGDDWSGIPAHLLDALPVDRTDPGRWLVSDFWADRVLLDLRFRQRTEHFGIMTTSNQTEEVSCPLRLEDYRHLRDQLLRPTFVAVILPEAKPEMPLFERLWTHYATDGSVRFHHDWPGDERAAVESMTREFTSALPPNCSLVPINPGAPEVIAEEIAAACRASHPC